MRVVPDELAHFIDQEYDPVLRPLGVQVLLDPLAEVLDRHCEVVFGSVEPFLGRVWLWPSASLNALTISSRLNW